MLDPLVEDGCTLMVLLSKDQLVDPLLHHNRAFWAGEGLYLVRLIQRVIVGVWVGGVVSLVVGDREGGIPKNVQAGDQQFAAAVSSACPSSAPVGEHRR